MGWLTLCNLSWQHIYWDTVIASFFIPHCLLFFMLQHCWEIPSKIQSITPGTIWLKRASRITKKKFYNSHFTLGRMEAESVIGGGERGKDRTATCLAYWGLCSSDPILMISQVDTKMLSELKSQSGWLIVRVQEKRSLTCWNAFLFRG